MAALSIEPLAKLQIAQRAALHFCLWCQEAAGLLSAASQKAFSNAFPNNTQIRRIVKHQQRHKLTHINSRIDRPRSWRDHIHKSESLLFLISGCKNLKQTTGSPCVRCTLHQEKLQAPQANTRIHSLHLRSAIFAGSFLISVLLLDRSKSQNSNRWRLQLRITLLSSLLQLNQNKIPMVSL